MSESFSDRFSAFLEAAPTSYHAAQLCVDELTEEGFVELSEREPWVELPDRAVIRRDGAVLAWVAPCERGTVGLRVFGAHTDSPALKLKPAGSVYLERANCTIADVEVYGGGLLYSWFDRDLQLAGRIIDSRGEEHLVRLPGVGRVTSLAPHLDRSIADTFSPDRQRDMAPVIGLGRVDIEDAAAKAAGVADPLAADLFFCSDERPRLLGLNRELLAGPRMDNLLSTFAGLAAIRCAEASEGWQIFVAFDHEEIGSGTASGAAGSFLTDVLNRIADRLGMSPDAHEAWLARGCCLSADVAHGLHPNRPDRHEPHLAPTLMGGPTLKWSAPMRYATDAVTGAAFIAACRDAGVSHQVFTNHGNIPGGSTIGALSAARTGIPTVDVGVPIWSMHSLREVCAADAPEQFARVVSVFLRGKR